MNYENFFKKNIAKRTAIILALFIPLVIAVIFAFSVDPNAISPNTLGKIIVTSPDGDQSTLDTREDFELYSSIRTDAKKTDETFLGSIKVKEYSVNFYEANDSVQPVTYKIFMSTNKDDCVFKDAKGNFYRIAPEVAQKLIGRSEFNEINDQQYLPTLTLSGYKEGITLTPHSYDWTFTTLNGDTETSKKSKPSVKNNSINFNPKDNASLTLLFTDANKEQRDPDKLTVTLTQGSNKIFDDIYSDLPTFFETYSPVSDTPLVLDIVAEWYNIDNAQSHGKIHYSTSVVYDIAPTYTIVNKNGVNAGDFTILKIENFNDGEKLTIRNEIGIPEVVNVYDHADGYKFAFIPMNSSLTMNNTGYSLALITESGNIQEVIAKVNKNFTTPQKQEIILDPQENQQLLNAFSAEAFEEIETLLSDLTPNSKNQLLYDGKFVYPTNSSSKVAGGAGYGTPRKVLGTYTREYTHSGIDLAASSGQSVKASNNGVVVFAGQTLLLGNTVIIDHGYGILTHYGHLESISVEVGDVVTKSSTVIGMAGSSGFACTLDGAAAKNSTMVYFAVSFGGVYIDPSSPIQGGVIF